MIYYYLLIAACILIIIIALKKREDMETRGENGIAYLFWKNSLEFLIPFAIVMFLYIVLLVVASRTSDTASLGFLVRLEEILTTIKSYAYFKLSAVTVLICFLVLYLLGFLRFSPVKRKKLYSSFDWYRKWSKRVYILLVLLCSLTLFGTQVGKPTSDLNLRIKTIREGYADVQREAEEAISQEVTRQLFDKVRDSLPQSYPQALELSKDLNAKTGALVAVYSKAQNDYRINVAEAEAIVKSYAAQRASGPVIEFKVSEETAATGTRGSAEPVEPNASKPDLDKISHERIESAKTAVKLHKQNSLGRFRILESEGGKEVILQLPKVGTSKLKRALFAPVFEVYPITEVFFDAVFDTLDDAVKSRIGKRIDEAAKAIINDPKNIQRAVNDAAAKTVSETQVKVSAPTSAKAEQARTDMGDLVAKVEGARALVDKAILQAENKQIVDLIAQLRNPKAGVREGATRTLSHMGAKLSQAHVNELVRIMKGGGQRWSEFLRRESHCSWYEYTSVRYYAAGVLEDLKSPHVNEQLAREASRVRSNSRSTERVMDPGWI